MPGIFWSLGVPDQNSPRNLQRQEGVTSPLSVYNSRKTDGSKVNPAAFPLLGSYGLSCPKPVLGSGSSEMHISSSQRVFHLSLPASQT